MVELGAKPRGILGMTVTLVDTNVFLYFYDPSASEKRGIARQDAQVILKCHFQVDFIIYGQVEIQHAGDRLE